MNELRPTLSPVRERTSYVAVPAVVQAEDADFETGVRCVVMPCCGFTFDAQHFDTGGGVPTYTCPLCTGSFS